MITRLGLNGYGVRRTGDFSGRGLGHPVNKITRLGLNGYSDQRPGSFADKGTVSGPHPVDKITRLGLSGYVDQRPSSFSDKGGASGPHPVGKITRFFNGYMTRRSGDFSGKAISQPIEQPTGGYEYLRYLPLREREEVEEIVTEIATKASYEPKKVDIEIGLRLRLEQRDLKYRKKYLEIAYNEALKEFKRREEEEIALLMLL